MGLTQKLGTIPLAIFTDASNNVGIGGSPSGSYTLDVTGTGRFTGGVLISGTITAGLSNGNIRLKGSTDGFLGVGETDGKLYLSDWNTATKGLVINLSTGNVGIGTSSPSRLLTVVSASDGITAGISGATYGIRFDNGGTFSSGMSTIHGVDSTLTGSYQPIMINGSDVRFGTSATERMRITNQAGTANLVVGGTSSPQSAAGRTTIISNGTSTALLGLSINGGERGYLYHNDGEMYLNQSVNGQRLYVASSSGGVYLNSGATSWTANSDERLKDITGNIDNAVDSLMTLRAIKHTWKADEDKVEKLALIAQDVEKVFPQVIDKGKLPSKPDEEQKDETEYLGVRYTELIPVLVKAIQELNAKVSALENKS